MRRIVLLGCFGWLTLAGCTHDPAHDRPIEPWGSPAVPPLAQIGDDGGQTPERVDAGPAK